MGGEVEQGGRRLNKMVNSRLRLAPYFQPDTLCKGQIYQGLHMRMDTGTRTAAFNTAIAVDETAGLDLAGFAARLKRSRSTAFLSSPGLGPLPLLALAACGGGAASPAPNPAAAPAVAAPTITPVTPPAVTPGPGATASGNVLPAANQSGASAATVSAVSIAGGASGSVGQPLTTALGSFTLNSNGSYNFTVADNDAVKSLPGGVSQDITINFTAGNSAGSTSSSLKFTVTGINDAPVASNDSITAPAVVTGPITGNVLTNDSDIDRGTTLNVTGITPLAAQVSLSISAPGGGGGPQQLPSSIAAGTFGTITMNPDGSYSYTLDKGNADFIALRGGQTATEKFEYTISDGAGGTAKAVLSIVVTGENDGPTVSNVSGNVTEDAITNKSTGNIVIADPDISQIVSITSVNGTAFTGSSTSITGVFGNLSLNSNGNWTYTLDNSRAATNALAQNTQATEIFSVNVQDAAGITGTGTITISVTGANDAPTVTSATGAVTEDTTPNTATGSITVSDIDNGQSATISSVNGNAFTGSFTNFNGTYGTLGLNSSGNWTYTLDNSRAATNALAQNTQATEIFSVNVQDAAGITGTGTITIRVTGANDAPTVTSATGAVVEDATLNTATGSITVSDVDNGQSATISSVNGNAFTGGFTNFNGTYGTLGLNSTGNWTYTLDNSRAATQSLSGGQQVTETFAVTARDLLGATGAGNIVVTVTGAADVGPAITVNPDVLNLSSSNNFEGSINVLANDRSTNVGSLRLATVNGITDPPALGVYQFTSTFGAFHFNFFTGQIDYRVRFDDPDLISVAAGTIPRDVLTYTVVDQAGLTQTSTLTVQLPTKTMAPIAVADNATMIQGDTIVGKQLFANDSDPEGGPLYFAGIAQAGGSFMRAERLTLGNPGLDFTIDYGYVTFARSGGGPGFFQFRADTATAGASPTLFDNLAGGQIVSRVFQYQVRDDSGAIGTSSVTLNIVGRNDAPTVTSATGAVTEDAPINISTGTISFNDIDTNDTLKISNVNGTAFTGTSANFNGTYGTLSLNSSGNWTYTLDNSRPSTQALIAGQTVTDSFAVAVQDSLGATASGSIAVSVNGQNESLTAVADLLEITPTLNPSINLLANDIGNVATMRLSWVWTAVFAAPPGGTSFFSSGDFYFRVNSNGMVNVSPRDSYFSLRAGEVLTRTYDYGLVDGVSFQTGQLTIRATGKNDAPEFTTPGSIRVLRSQASSLDLLPPTDVDSPNILVKFSQLPTGGKLYTSDNIEITGSTELSAAQLSGVYFLSNLGATSVGSITIVVNDRDGEVISRTISMDFYANEILGTSGHDILTGTTGSDAYIGLSGNDRFITQGGEDVFYGGIGIDSVDFGLAISSVNMGLLDSKVYSSVERVLGSSFNDTLRGDENNNHLIGRNGDDILDGNGGNDIIVGGLGADLISGGDGNDLLLELDGQAGLSGGAGDDLLVARANASVISIGLDGGAGADTFIIATQGAPIGSANFNVRIQNFNWAEGDKYDFSDILDESGSTLDINDIIAHATNYSEAGVSGTSTVISLNGFTSAEGPISGQIFINENGGVVALNGLNFVFSNGVDWQSQLTNDLTWS